MSLLHGYYNQEKIKSFIKECEEQISFVMKEPVFLTYEIKPLNLSEALIRMVVCEAFETDWQKITGLSRVKHITAARSCYCYLCSVYMNEKAMPIAVRIHRDRTTVISCVQEIKKHLSTGDQYIIAKLIPIIKKINALYAPKEI